MTALFDILSYSFLIFSHFATQNKNEKSFAKIPWTCGKRVGLLYVSASTTAALKTGVTDPMVQVSEAITNAFPTSLRFRWSLWFLQIF